MIDRSGQTVRSGARLVNPWAGVWSVGVAVEGARGDDCRFPDQVAACRRWGKQRGHGGRELERLAAALADLPLVDMRL